jgi:KaiC/GvpD/RAD55 family RecA-like ATPase
MNVLITQSLTESNVTHLYQFPRVLIESWEGEWIDWIREYTVRHSTPPSLERFAKEWDTFVPVDKGDPITDTYEQALVKKRNFFARRYLMEHMDEINDGADPAGIIDKLHMVMQMGDVEVLKYSEFDRTRYFRESTSFPYGIEKLDQYTGGANAGDLIYFFGRLGTGKTTMVLWIIKKWLEDGHKILVISNENRADDIVSKIDAFMGGWNPLKKRLREWTPDDETRIRTVSHIAAHLDGELIIPTVPIDGVDKVQALMHSHQPDIVIIDGVYLLSENKGDSANWEKLTDVSRNLKRMADGHGVPIIGVHQANRAAAGKEELGVENIAYSDALGQDADLIIGISPEDNPRELYIHCVKNRWGSPTWSFFVRLHFDTMTVKVLPDVPLKEEEDE